MRFAAVGFTCIDVYKNLNISYPTGNGIDLMFNLMDLVPELVPSVVTAIGDDAYGQSMLEACQKRKVDTGHVTIVSGGQTAVIEMLLNGRDRVHHRAEKGVMIPYQPTGEDMDFIRTQDYIHTDLSWNVTGLLKDMRSKGTKIYFDFSKRYQHEDVPTILKNINYGIFSFEEETEEVRELLRMGCSMGAEVLIGMTIQAGRFCCWTPKPAKSWTDGAESAAMCAAPSAMTARQTPITRPARAATSFSLRSGRPTAAGRLPPAGRFRWKTEPAAPR